MWGREMGCDRKKCQDGPREAQSHPEETGHGAAATQDGPPRESGPTCPSCGARLTSPPSLCLPTGHGHGLQHTAPPAPFPNPALSLASGSRSSQMTPAHSLPPGFLACHEVVGCQAALTLPGPRGRPPAHQVRRSAGRGLCIAPHPPDWPHPLPVPFHTVCTFNGDREAPRHSPCPSQGWDGGQCRNALVHHCPHC